MTQSTGHWPVHGWLGATLVIVCWALNWSLPGLRTQWAFFPLWLGYCLTVDALVYMRKGTSMLTRSRKAYAGLFLVSLPAWWLFELINLRTQNWFYAGRECFTDIQYFALASLSFSTVMPAVFGTTELVSTFGRLKRIKPGPVVAPTRTTLFVLFASGALMLLLLLLRPLYFYPLVWISLYLILEPVNVLLRNRSLLRYTAVGDWRPLFALAIGCLICGFFWEMWNFYSYPKWIYQIPFVDFLHVFEMPLLGYTGYIPFSFELFAVYHLIAGKTEKEDSRYFIQVGP